MYNFMSTPHIGSKLITAWALDSMLSSTKVKVKVHFGAKINWVDFEVKGQGQC